MPIPPPELSAQVPLLPVLLKLLFPVLLRMEEPNELGGGGSREEGGGSREDGGGRREQGGGEWREGGAS
jgi:hypothetical protein